MKIVDYQAYVALLFAFAAALAGCQNGGGAQSMGTGTAIVTGVPVVSQGVVKKGSVIVNGVTYDVDATQFENDDSPGSANLLQEGMQVKVRGRLHDDNVTGTAETMRTECELQGTITAVGSDSITLLGQQVYTDRWTVYANVENFQALAPDQWVEVHGIRDQLDRLLATRIEVRLSTGGPPSDRLKGAVAAPFAGGTPPGLSFRLRGLTVVTTDGTVIRPEGASISPGDPVEIHGFLSGTIFTAGRIDRQDLEESEFEPRNNDRYKSDGFISGFTGPDADFMVDGTTVRITGTTTFEGCSVADLANNIRIIVEGLISSGVLLAERIRFDDSEIVYLMANTADAGKADLLGKTVVITGLTEFHNITGGLSGIRQGQGLKVRGFGNDDGTITARQIEGFNQPVDPAKILLQGIVESYDIALRSFVVLGITVNAPKADDRFFSKLSVNRSIVEAEGTFTAGPPPVLTAEQIQIK